MTGDREDKDCSLEEKRLFPRFPANIKVEMKVGGDAYSDGNDIIEIGLGGFSLKTGTKLSVSDVVPIRINSKSPVFEGYGEVTWITGKDRSYQVGFKFVKMTGATIDSLHKLLKHVKDKVFV